MKSTLEIWKALRRPTGSLTTPASTAPKIAAALMDASYISSWNELRSYVSWMSGAAADTAPIWKPRATEFRQARPARNRTRDAMSASSSPGGSVSRASMSSLSFLPRSVWRSRVLGGGAPSDDDADGAQSHAVARKKDDFLIERQVSVNVGGAANLAA